MLHRLNIQHCTNTTGNGFQHLTKCSTLQVTVACNILNEWPIAIVADTHMLCLQELSLNGVLLHTLKKERAGLLLVILEVTRDQGLVALDISGKGLGFEAATLIAAFLHSNR